MNWLDILLLLVVLLSTVSAAQKGFSREVVGIGAAIIGLVLGVWCYGLAGSFLLPYVSSPQVANFIGFFIVFVACVIVGAIISSIMRRFMRAVGLSWFDRLLGAAFGVVRGTLLAMAVITAMVAFAPAVKADSVPASVAQSRIAPYIVTGANYLIAIAPRELKDSFHTHYAELKSYWEQKQAELPKRQDL
jgi:membrane protein required for colicin V production